LSTADPQVGHDPRGHAVGAGQHEVDLEVAGVDLRLQGADQVGRATGLGGDVRTKSVFSFLKLLIIGWVSLRLPATSRC
jgi:hypothetical protein